MTDANAINPEKSRNSDEFVAENSLLPDNKPSASDLAEKLVRELAQAGIQCDDQTQMLLQAQITAANDPQEKYQQLRKEISGQLHTATREDQQMEGASFVVLGVVVLGIFGLLSQCASMFEPPLDVTTFRSCINSGYPEDFCTRNAREAYQGGGRGYP
jgi:hypothetical protein